MDPQRTALLIRCTAEEAERIRHEAKRERRTLSGYVINAVMNRIESREKAFSRFEAVAPQQHQRPATKP